MQEGRMNKTIELRSTDASGAKRKKPIKRLAERSAAGAAETGKSVGTAGRKAIPHVAHLIRSEQAMPILRIVRSALIARIGTALVRRAARRPLVAALGIGFVVAAILTPERKNESKAANEREPD
jgi:hypothetical protein